MRKQLAQVEQFHKVFGVHIEHEPTARIPKELADMRFALMEEELEEYQIACQNGDIVEVADALTDMLYVVLGTIITHGLQDIAVELFDEVHRSNMSKLDENGDPIYREDGKVLKSPAFSPPDLEPIIAACRSDESRR